MMHALDAAAQPRRRAILRLVWDQERTAGDIARAFPEVTFGAISQHLAVLREAGLVRVRRDGRRRYYSARRDAMGPLADVLELAWSQRLHTLSRLAEGRAREVT